MGVRIISDSTTEISQEEARKLNIAIVPLRSHFGSAEYLDGVDITPEEFYQKLADSKEMPTTSQPTPYDFAQHYCRARNADDQLVVITLSKKLSGTWQSAQMARESQGIESGNIWIVDSGTVTLGLHILVKRAIELRDAGKTAVEIARTIESEKSSVRIFAAIDTLEYLHKGGRLSRTSTVAGTLLNIKPILEVRDGVIKVVGKCRGLSKSYVKIFQLINKTKGIDFSKPLSIGYSGNRERFQQFQETSRKYLGDSLPIVSSIGSVIGTHAGPGAVALSFFERSLTFKAEG